MIEEALRTIVLGLLDAAGAFIMGRLGSWTAWLLSFGRWDVDDESWTAIIIGWVVFVGVIVWMKIWRG